MPDKYKATWVSYSSISDFLKCPRAYYLKQIYKNPKTGKKIEIVNPPLALGKAVHNVLEPLAKVEPVKRFENDLTSVFDVEFSKYSGIKGGFTTDVEYDTFRLKGHKMLENVMAHKNILEGNTYNLSESLLSPWLSMEKNIIVCGKIDWINQDETTGALSVIDFKTSKEEEVNDLQLQIYALLLKVLNKETVNRLYYWYVNLNGHLTETNLPNVKDSHAQVMEIALRIQEARAAGKFECPRGGCFACRDFERILAGEAQMVGTGEYGKEIYVVDPKLVSEVNI